MELVMAKSDSRYEFTLVPEMEGFEAAGAYLLNYGNMAYGKFLIDQNSLRVFEKNLHKLVDQKSRLVIYF
jgi:hypothetical protein